MSDLYIAIATQATDLLTQSGKVATETEFLYQEIDLMVTALLLQYTELGAAYTDLTGTDKLFFDAAVGHLIAAKLHPTLTNDLTRQALIKKREGDFEKTYSDPSKQPAPEVPLPEQWAGEAWRLFSLVTAIADKYAVLREGFSPLALAGRRRAAETAGYVYGSLNPLLVFLGDEARALLRA